MLTTKPIKDSWKAADVARQQRELVVSELRAPEKVAPFKAFVAVMDCVTGGGSKFLDIGCGVGHYSELLRRYFPGQFGYTGCDYSPTMIETAQELWPDTEFVVDDLFDSQLNYWEYDIIMASALVDVIEDFWDALDILCMGTSNLLILHRLRLTDEASYTEPGDGYIGQTTYVTQLNLNELCERLTQHGLTLRKNLPVTGMVRSLLIERVQ